MSNHSLTKLQEALKNHLPEKRYIHTLGVQYTAACLAMRYNAELEPVQTAALLHDCAKYHTDEKMLSRCNRYGIAITDTERNNPYLLHGKLGAFYAENKYGITDLGILGAIIWHTTGKPDMSLIEKIIFCADYIESGRKLIPGLSKIRHHAFVNLDKTVLLILKHTLEYLRTSDNKKAIDPMTEKAYEYYKIEVGNCEIDM